jgi:large subunit ribosomal protein L17
MAVIELVQQKTVTSEADRARRVTSSQRSEKPAATPAEVPVEPAVADATGPVADAEVDESTSTEDAPYGEGSHAPLDDPQEAPAGFPIKGNADSMLYHVPGSSHYGQTVAEVWFASEEAAEAAGFAAPASQRSAEAEAADEGQEP